jgi:hypothetical protein
MLLLLRYLKSSLRLALEVKAGLRWQPFWQRTNLL